MNLENMKRLRNALLTERARGRPRLGFNMQEYATKSSNVGGRLIDHLDNCGTVACLWGWTTAIRAGLLAQEGPVFAPELFIEDFDDISKATEWLGLTEKQADDFFMLTPRDDADLVTLDQALAHLTSIIEAEEWQPWPETFE